MDEQRADRSLVDTKDLIHILVDSQEQRVALSELITVLIFCGQNGALILVQLLFQFGDTSSRSREISFTLLEILYERR